MEVQNVNVKKASVEKNAKHFKHVSYLWNEAEAAKLAGDEVALLIYRSNLL